MEIQHRDRSTDALVIGGGPAGLAAAIALRLKGLDVLVVDALQPPIDKACGEGLMPDARASLAALGISLSEEDGVGFDGISFLFGERQVTASFSHGRGMGIRRLRLHALLSERCREIGVRTIWGASAAVRPRMPVLMEGKEIIYRYLIGADGQASRVRMCNGLNGSRRVRSRFAARRHFRIVPWNSKVEVHWSAAGQAYVTPVSQDQVCVATVSSHPGAGFEMVLESLPGLRGRLQSAAEVSRFRGAVSVTRRLPRVTYGNTALIGDASGSVDAVTGEGLALSFRQALSLGQAIEAGNLAMYESEHLHLMRLPRAMSGLLLGMDRSRWLRESAARILEKDPRIFAKLLDLHLGESTISAFALREAARLGWWLLAQGAAIG